MKVEGYASTWFYVDHALDAVQPGAFDASIRERRLNGPRGIKLLAQHDRNLPIGVIKELESDDKGLRIEADIDESISYAKDLANAIRANNGLNYSIGYRIPAGGMEFYEDGLNSHFKLHRVDLLEISVVTFPCNDQCFCVLPKSAEQRIADSIATMKAAAQPHDPFAALSKSLNTLLKGSRP